MMNSPCPTSIVITALLPHCPLFSERECSGRKCPHPCGQTQGLTPPPIFSFFSSLYPSFPSFYVLLAPFSFSLLFFPLMFLNLDIYSVTHADVIHSGARVGSSSLHCSCLRFVSAELVHLGQQAYFKAQTLFETQVLLLNFLLLDSLVCSTPYNIHPFSSFSIFL